METWQILKGQEVITSYTNTQDITYNFPANDTDEDIQYTINYTSDTNTTATLDYVIPKCETPQCTCDDLTLNATTVELAGAAGSSTSITYTMADSCDGNVTIKSTPDWITANINAGTITITTNSDNVDGTSRNGYVILQVNDDECTARDKKIDVTQRPKSRTVTIRSITSFDDMEKGKLNAVISINNGGEVLTFSQMAQSQGTTSESGTSTSSFTFTTSESIETLLNNVDYNLYETIGTITHNNATFVMEYSNGLDKFVKALTDEEAALWTNIPEKLKSCGERRICVGYIKPMPRKISEDIIELKLTLGATITPRD